MPIKPSNFVINTADLTYILKQIKIAEATSLGYTPAVAPVSILQAIMDAYGVSAANAAQLPAGLRTVDGSFNNLHVAPSGTPGTPDYNPGTSEYGAADNLFPRLTDPVYMNEGDEGSFNGITSTNYGVAGNVVDSDPRTISNLIVDMSIRNPAAVEAYLNNPLSLAAFEAAHPGKIAVAPGDSRIVYHRDVFDVSAFNNSNGTTPWPTSWVETNDDTNEVGVGQIQINGGAMRFAVGDGATITRAVSLDPAGPTTLSYVYSFSGLDTGDTLTVQFAANGTDWVTIQTIAGATANNAIQDPVTFSIDVNGTANSALRFTTTALTDIEGIRIDDLAFANQYVAVSNEDLQTIPNQSPDLGLTAGFNSWMTYFGQFFDHGLDLVTKGNAGTVYIPLALDDPLYNPGPNGIYGDGDDARTNFMALTRATQTLDANGVPQHENTTTPFIDQNQTYTSHASHQVFLREYAKDASGNAVSTGKMLDGINAAGITNGMIANWSEVKAQAITMLGLKMGDFAVHNAPLLATDQYGKFLPGSNGYAQVAVQLQIVGSNGAVVSSGAQYFMNGVAGGLDLDNLPVPAGLAALPAGQSYRVVSMGTGHAFLNDIAHHAGPAMVDHDTDDRNSNGIKDSTEGPDPDVAATPMIRQVADDDYGDANNDGFANADRNLDGIVTAAELVADDGNRLTYDDEMLNAHFITGDGRGNENIALTAVHSIFHSEHNRTVDDNKATILASGDLAFINEWLQTDIGSLASIDTPAKRAALIANAAAWDGERLFQAARFTTEMQYQHLVFEEFARRIQPMIDPFVFNNSPEIDASILAEFAHTVYRFGHSMLTGTVDRLDNNLQSLDGADQATLLAVFLNPQAYVGSGATVEEINANLVRGLSRDVGNSIDEFIVSDVRDNLVGLPLDLGALNIARGRDTGIPSLNETRRQLYDDTGLADLKPYDSWADFAANIKNAASIVNFIAAYGTHSTITSAITMADKRAAAEAIVFGGTGAPGDRLDFINATGAFAGGSLGGLNTVDLWIGGLAEANPEFGGMLGTTFNYVFEAQMEMLQNGDRLYYLTRTQGTNILNQLEPNTFSDLVMRNTDLGDVHATHLSGALFVTPDLILELDRGIAQEDYNGIDVSGRDPDWEEGEPHSPFDQKVTRDYTASTSVDGHDVGGTLRFKGGEHVVLGGTEGDDKLYGDLGDDTLWGDGGNDYLNGGTAADDVFGGDGDDIIEDPFGDDVLRGQAGNDVITSARGFDLMFGGSGQDAIFVGQDASEVFAGEDNDFVLGGAGSDFLLGGEGDDWMEGGPGFDTLAGDNSELFFNSPLIGHDVLFGQGDEVDYDAESGDDIMGAGASVYRYEGMYGFDWGIGKGQNSGVDHDLNIKIFTAAPNEVLRDRFDHVEALSGYTYNDVLTGDDRGRFVPGTATTDLTADALFLNDILTQEGINRINGFNAWFGGGDATDARQTLFGGPNPLVIGTETATSYRDGNILMGGDGSDTLHGRGGFDLLDGDAYLNVRISIKVGDTYYSAESLSTNTSVAGEYAGRVYAMLGNNPLGEVDFTNPAFGGRSLNSLLLDRTVNPGQMSIVREIKYDNTNVTGELQNIDTAVFHGTLAEYDIEGRTVDANGVQLTRARDVNGDGFISVHDRDDGVTGATVNGVVLPSRRLLVDDTDLVRNIEDLKFSDQTLIIAGPNLGRPVLDLHAFNVVPAASVYFLDDFNIQSFSNSAGSNLWDTSWVETNDDDAIGTGQIQTNENFTEAMRFIAGDGASITRAVDLDGLGPMTLSYVYSYSGLDTGDELIVEFAANGIDFVELQTIEGAVATNANLGPTKASFTVTGTATSALRFTTSALTDIEGIRIDNVGFLTVNTTQYLDDFNIQSFSNSAGKTAWNTSWVETNDDNAIGTGQIQTNENFTEAMRFVAGDGASITRAVDLGGLGPMTLSYVYSYSGIDTGDSLTVEFASDGINFVTVQTIAGAIANNSNLGPTKASFTVTGTANSALRFTTSALTDIEGIRIDNVSFMGGHTVQVPVSDGTGFTSTFTENGPPVRIALNSAVTNTEGSPVVSAQIRLTNAQALDALSIAGALPGGITSTINTAVPGQITINLAGSASPADYQTAIEAVRFSNTSQNPSATPRNISVTVDDVDNVSLAATATINVVPVNDAPVTVADAVVTNIASGNIVIPEWALLANDTDVDSTVLDVTAVSAAVGVTGLSLATNSGSVTFADDATPGGTFTYTASDGNVVNGSSNAAVTMTNVSPTNVADNFNGPNTATPSAANNSTGATAWTTSWIEANDDANIRTGQIQIDAGASPGTNALRFGIGDGGSISRVVNLAGVTSATLSLSFDKTGIDANESVQVQFAADGINFVTLSTITSGGGNGGVNANGTLNLALIGALSANSAIRFVGSAINGLTNGVADPTENLLIDDVLISYGAPNAAITGGAGNQILVGNEAGTSFTGGAGNDFVLANGGDDIINWSVGDGRDFVDGGANGAAGDRFIANGDATVENFVVYARAEAIAAGVVVQNSATEIVITRNGIANVVAELDNVEEITINTGAGADSVIAVGNFGPTSLAFNTITVNGQGGRDTIDASLLTSEHKLVLNRGAGGSTGSLDVIDGLGNFSKGLMMRMSSYELDFYGQPALAELGAESVFVADGKYNPIFERSPTVELASIDVAEANQYRDSALHLYAADYLII